MSFKMNRRGFTIIELLVVLAIISLIAGLTLSSLTTFRSRRAVKNAAAEIVSALTLARSRTLNGLNDTVHGVYFATSSLVIFSGGIFNPNDPSNQAINLIPAGLAISLTNGQSVIFNRRSGVTNNVGTITITNGQASQVVTILGSGLAAGAE